MTNTIAQAGMSVGSINGIGPLGTPGSGAPSLFAKILSGIIGLMTVIAAIWFVFLLISGAIGVMSAGGDKVAVENARKRMTTGLLGFIIVIAAMFIMDLIANILGIPDILDIGNIIDKLSP